MNESDLHSVLRLCRICVGYEWFAAQDQLCGAVGTALCVCAILSLGLTTFLVLKSSVLGSYVAIHNSAQTPFTGARLVGDCM